MLSNSFLSKNNLYLIQIKRLKINLSIKNSPLFHRYTSGGCRGKIILIYNILHLLLFALNQTFTTLLIGNRKCGYNNNKNGRVLLEYIFV